MHLGCRLRASWTCPIPCAHPLFQIPLRAPDWTNQNHHDGLSGCAHQCPNRPLRASVSEIILGFIRLQITKIQHWDPNFDFYYGGFTTEDDTEPLTTLGFRLHEEWFRSIVYPLIDKGCKWNPLGVVTPVVQNPSRHLQLDHRFFWS